MAAIRGDLALLPTSRGREAPPRPETRDEPRSPLYRQVRDALADHVATGRLRVGEQLPSERELVERFGVSRVTLRRALRELADDGVIVPAAGRGWFVTDQRVVDSVSALASFTELAVQRGLQPTADVLKHEVRPSSMDEADLLAVAPGSRVLELVRVRYLDGLPVALDHSVVPLILTPGLEALDFRSASLWKAMRDLGGLLAARAECTIEAVPADSTLAAHLALTEGAPVLVSRQVVLDQHGRPMENNRVTYRGDRYRLRTSMVAGA